MRQPYADFNTRDLVSELVSMVILQVDRQGKAGAKREAQSVVGPHCGQSVDVGDLDVEHDDLIAERSSFLHQQCHFAVLIKRSDSLIIHELNDWTCGLLILILSTCIVEHTLLRVA